MSPIPMIRFFHLARASTRKGSRCPSASGAPRVLNPVMLWRVAAAGLLCAGSFAVGTVCRAQDHPHKEHKRDYKREIELVEEQWKTAQLTGDVATMDKLLADDYFSISMNGQLNDKTQQLDRLKNRTLVLSKIDLSDVRIKLLGRVAIVTSLAKIEGTDSSEPIRGIYRYTRVYKRYPDGSWKITNFEVTKVPQE